MLVLAWLATIPNGLAVPVEVDSYAETNYDSYLAMGDLHPSDSGSWSSCGQSFTMLADGNYKLTSVKFYARKYGSPTGNAHAVLYVHSGTYGTSSTPGLELARSDDFDISTLTTSEAFFEITFSGAEQYEMQASTYYIIQFEAPTSGTLDGSNWIRFARDSSSPAHDGTAVGYYNGGWSSLSGSDAVFYVYGEAVATGQNIIVDLPETFGVTADLYTQKNLYRGSSATTGITGGNFIVKSLYRGSGASFSIETIFETEKDIGAMFLEEFETVAVTAVLYIVSSVELTLEDVYAIAVVLFILAFVIAVSALGIAVSRKR